MPYGIVAFAVAGLLPWLLVLAAIAAQVYWISLALELGQPLDGVRPPIVQPATLSVQDGIGRVAEHEVRG